MAAVSVKRSIGQEDKRKARDTHTPTHSLASTICVVWSACTRLGSKEPSALFRVFSFPIKNSIVYPDAQRFFILGFFYMVAIVRK